MLTVGLLVNFIVLVIFLVILFLVGRWGLVKLGLGDPWPTILGLLILVIAIFGLYHLFIGGGFIRVGELGGAMMPLIGFG